MSLSDNKWLIRLRDLGLKAQAESITIAGKLCRLIGLEDLIKAKEAIGREKDLLAVKELRAISLKRTSK